MKRVFPAVVLILSIHSSAAAADNKVWPITDYGIIGDGPQKVLVIPCMSCRWRAFDEFMERNADKYTTYALTIPGFGASTVPELPLWSDQPVWHENAVAAVHAFIKEHNVEDAIVISHSWGAVLATEVLHANPDFAKAWIILDTYVPMNADDEALPYDEKLKLVSEWRRKTMEPIREPDEWASFNSVSGAYFEPERRLLYHGMFMSTPPDVLFQYWRENGLVNLNNKFSSIEVPTYEIKSLPLSQEDIEGGKTRYRARYETAPHPVNFETYFIERTGHHQVEHRPAIIDEIVSKVAAGAPLRDHAPAEDDKYPRLR